MALTAEESNKVWADVMRDNRQPWGEGLLKDHLKAFIVELDGQFDAAIDTALANTKAGAKGLLTPKQIRLISQRIFEVRGSK